MSSTTRPSHHQQRQQRPNKRSAFSCEPCRQRKVKCGGEHPVCARCIARGDECLYKLNPSLSYTKKLELRIDQLERELAEARALPPPISQQQQQQQQQQEAAPRSTDIHVVTNLSSQFRGLAVGDHGGVVFHGPSSFLHLPTTSSQADRPEAARTDDGDDDEGRNDDKELLISSAKTERAVEQVYDLPESIRHLLNSHWCWIHPLFNFIYRPAFTRDMKSRGPYYSDLLLNAMLLHSVRWCQANPCGRGILGLVGNGTVFEQSINAALLVALDTGPATIPTVQALLLLSAQSCGMGKLTKAWLYSGMAFRLIEDLGIVIDGRKYAGNVQFSAEDIEIRNRLFWACYIWDKQISLYLGRAPTLQYSSASPPRIILDDSAERDIWVPQGLDGRTAFDYPPQQARSTSCFIQFCGVAEILNVVLTTLYNPTSRSTDAETHECVVSQSKALSDWFEALPQHLRLTLPDLPSHSPPSHIVTLNCSYHMVNILLHRPMLASQHTKAEEQASVYLHHLQQCVRSATAIVAIFDLLVRSFGFNHICLSQSYTVFTAASIFLLQVQAMKDLNPYAFPNLRYCIDSLEKLKLASPVIGSALSLIYKQLDQQGIFLRVQTDSDGLWESQDMGNLSNGSDFSSPADNHVDYDPALAWDPQLMEMDFIDTQLTQDMVDALANTAPISVNVQGALLDLS